MILLYTSVLLLLGGVKLLVDRRAASLGRKYTVLAEKVQNWLRDRKHRPGNANFDQCQLARSQLELGLLVQRRDRLEEKHFAWQLWSERLNRWLDNLRHWRGQKLPYTLGAVDVWLVLTLIDHLGVGEFVSARRLFELTLSLFTS